MTTSDLYTICYFFKK